MNTSIVMDNSDKPNALSKSAKKREKLKNKIKNDVKPTSNNQILPANIDRPKDSSNNRNSFTDSEVINSQGNFTGTKGVKPDVARPVENLGSRVSTSSVTTNIATAHRFKNVERTIGVQDYPLIFDCVHVDVCGSEHSIAAAAFTNVMSIFVQMPLFFGDRTIIAKEFSSDFVKDYFRFASDAIAIRTILKAFMSLNDVYTAKFFKSSENLNNSVRDYVSDNARPFTSAYKSMVHELTTAIEKLYLPPEFVRLVEETYTPTLSSNDKREKLTIHCITIPVADDPFRKKNRADFFAPKNSLGLFLFPIGSPKDFRNIKTDLNNVLINSGRMYTKLINEITDIDAPLDRLHSLCEIGVPEWKIILQPDIAAYKIMTQTDWTIMNSSSLPIPSIPQVIQESYSVLDVREKKNVLTSFGIAKVFYENVTKVRNCTYTTVGEMDLDDNLDAKNITPNRRYTSPLISSCNPKGLCMGVFDFVTACFCFKVKNHSDNEYFEKNKRPVLQINEPGIVQHDNAPHGFNSIYYYNGGISDSVVYSIHATVDPKDAFAAIDMNKSYRFSNGFIIEVDGVREWTKDATSIKTCIVEENWASDPNVALFDLNFENIYMALYDRIRDMWESPTLLKEYDSRKPTFAREGIEIR